MMPGAVLAAGIPASSSAVSTGQPVFSGVPATSVTSKPLFPAAAAQVKICFYIISAVLICLSSKFLGKH